MTPNQLNYIVLLLFLLVLGPLFYQLLFQRKMERKVAELEKGIVHLTEKHNSLTNAKNALANRVITLQKASDYFQKLLDEKVKALNQMFTEIDEKTDGISQTREELLTEMNRQFQSLTTSLGEAKSQVTRFQESVKKTFSATEEEIRGLTKQLNHFSDELSKMKDHIRERNVDFEL
jgi:predicted  nucleic acid-binding Zn-ribbon protein